MATSRSATMLSTRAALHIKKHSSRTRGAGAAALTSHLVAMSLSQAVAICTSEVHAHVSHGSCDWSWRGAQLKV